MEKSGFVMAGFKMLYVATVLVATGVMAPAQWLNYPTPGVPKKADGSPNLAAPTLHTADGKPDLSGLWLLERNLPCPPGGCFDMQVSHEFFDIGWSIPGGLPYQHWAAELRKARMAENGKTNPWTSCRPNGVVKLTINPFFQKYIQLPGLLVILMERDTAYRQIFTDGRSLPADPLPTPNGYSVGKWDGDALVVETNGLSDGEWLDQNGSPLTDGAKITERFRRVNYGRMEIAITVDDPKAYTKPWTVKVNELIQTNTELMDYFCLENERDVSHLVGK
jgi:hypothetical protein